MKNAQAYILIGKPEGKRSIGISMHIKEDNIKMNLKAVEIGSSCWLL
jgi:hypothetical protein